MVDKFILFPERKYRREPRVLHGLPIVAFFDRRGRMVPFRRGRYLTPATLEEYYLSLLEESLPARAPRRKRRTPRRRRPAPRPVRPAPRPKTRRKAVPRFPAVPAGWRTADEVYAALEAKYKSLEIGKMAFNGFILQARNMGRYNRLMFPTPNLWSKRTHIVGFNMYVIIQNHNNSTGRDHEEYTLAGATVSWEGTLDEILDNAYEAAEVKGSSIQSAVRHRTTLDVFSQQFFGNAGDPIELVAVEPLSKFTKVEFQRVKALWQKHRALVKKYGKKKRKRRRK